MRDVNVVIPTRNRSEKLRRCLEALSAARKEIDFEIYVCDSSTSEEGRAAVEAACADVGSVHLRPHNSPNAGAARNFCTEVATGELIVSVDDDVYVEPEAVSALCAAYARDLKPGAWRVVAGSVRWGDNWSTPVVNRPIGYGRRARPEEQPSFIVTALFLYPRTLGLRLPWNERIVTRDDRICSDDRFIGALWRAKGVEMAFAPGARAVHDDELNRYGVKEQAAKIYVNLFDALIANQHLGRAACYEFLGFAAGAKTYFRKPGSAMAYLAAWYQGHRALIRDWRYLTELRERELPDPGLEMRERVQELARCDGRP